MSGFWGTHREDAWHRRKEKEYEREKTVEDDDAASGDLAQLLLNYNYNKLQRLRQNTCREFLIRGFGFEDEVGDDTFLAGAEWDDWNLLFMALLKNTSVENVNVELQCCPVESLVLLIKYIGTSPKLKTLIIQFDLQEFFKSNWTVDTDPEQQQEKILENYRSKIDDILHAVRQILPFIH
jgi:hypothetical protein